MSRNRPTTPFAAAFVNGAGAFLHVVVSVTVSVLRRGIQNRHVVVAVLALVENLPLTLATFALSKTILDEAVTYHLRFRRFDGKAIFEALPLQGLSQRPGFLWVDAKHAGFGSGGIQRQGSQVNPSHAVPPKAARNCGLVI
jgi:hypothetical protein